MTYNTEEVMDIVRAVLGDYAEGVFLNEAALETETMGDLYSDRNCSFNIEETDEVDVRHGITRVVLIPNDTDYVIKIPITGLYTEYEQVECEDVEIEDVEAEPHFVMSVDLDDYDVCEQEHAVYEYLSSEVKKIFADDIYVGKYNDIPIYVQEKVTTTQRYSSSALSAETIQQAYALTKSSHYFEEADSKVLNVDFIGKVIEMYGEKTAAFLLEECKTIDDLHSNNYGYNKEGLPIIFDYAGYDPEMYFY